MSKEAILYHELNELTIESIGFQRAGIDDVNFDRNRDNFVFNRIKDIEKELFPLLTNRVTLTFKNKPRPEFWKECDNLKYKGYIVVDNKIDCDMFNCETVSGTITFAKTP